MRDKEAIKTFVKKTLGCACPEDVFSYIDCRDNIEGSNNILLKHWINIGNRLLIYVVETDEPDFLDSNLSLLVNAGKSERDSRGFNRFRLVIFTDKIDLLKPVAERIFNTMDTKDEKVHLHTVSKNAICF